jgi:hypothetical protein
VRRERSARAAARPPVIAQSGDRFAANAAVARPGGSQRAASHGIDRAGAVRGDLAVALVATGAIATGLHRCAGLDDVGSGTTR